MWLPQMNSNNLSKNNFVLEEESIINWSQVQLSFQKNFGLEIYNSWLSKLSLINEYHDYLVLEVPTKFFRDWIVSRYLDKILEEIKKNKQSINRIEFKVAEDLRNTEHLHQPFKANVRDIESSSINYNRLNPKLNFDNFIEGESNKIALNSAKRICENLNQYNPLYIYGGVGLGKTHLLNAIGLELKDRSNVMFISAERFMYHFIKSIKKNDMLNFKDLIRKSAVFIIDDIQFLRGKEGLQEEFFHTFNSLIEKNSQIIVSADRSPNQLEKVQERIKSRLSGGLVVDISPPDLELKKKILINRIENYQNEFKESVTISDDILNYLANEVTTNIRELIGVLNRILTFSRVHKKDLSINECKQIIKDVYNQTKVLTIDKIQTVVAKYYDLTLNDMLSQRRSRPLARPRQIAMYLSKQLTTRSLPEIGRRFANRDHTTVIHAVKTINKFYEQNDEIKNDVNKIKTLLLEH